MGGHATACVRGVGGHATACVWRSEDDFQELVLGIELMSAGLHGKHFYVLSDVQRPVSYGK